MSRDFSGKPRQANFFDVCRECPNGCCTEVRPPLTNMRRRIILDYLSRNHICIDNPFENGKYVYPRETEDGRCIFLDRSTKRCKIHPVKPETCVAGPITFDIHARTGKIGWYLKTDKSCLLSAPLYKNDEAYTKHLRCAKREIRRLIQGIDVGALQAILIIEEPDTIKVGEDVAPPQVMTKLRSSGWSYQRWHGIHNFERTTRVSEHFEGGVGASRAENTINSGMRINRT